jgi:hypothetical protein
MTKNEKRLVRFAGGADARVPSTHWMIRLLMATKPRIAPAPDAPCVFLNGLPPASGRGRPAKGSLPLAADEACAKCPEEGTAHMGACHAVERAAHGGETPERHERASKRRPAPASAVARARRIGRPPRSRGPEQPMRLKRALFFPLRAKRKPLHMTTVVGIETPGIGDAVDPVRRSCGPQRLRERGTKALLLQRTAHAQASGASNHV